MAKFKFRREANYESKQRALERNATFSMEEIADVLELIRGHQYPDATYSDNECDLWCMIRRKLGINY